MCARYLDAKGLLRILSSDCFIKESPHATNPTPRPIMKTAPSGLAISFVTVLKTLCFETKICEYESFCVGILNVSCFFFQKTSRKRSRSPCLEKRNKTSLSLSQLSRHPPHFHSSNILIIPHHHSTLSNIFKPHNPLALERALLNLFRRRRRGFDSRATSSHMSNIQTNQHEIKIKKTEHFNVPSEYHIIF